MVDTGRSRPPEFEHGHRLGHYEILDLLGSGGMGQVYRARDLKLERTVALKCPRPDLANDPAFRRRFLREARAASALSHPNIVQVFDALEEDGLPWTVMEFVDGPTLRALLHDRRTLRAEDILRHAEGLAGGLDTAHHAGFLHRDIKPSNVLIGRDGRARLTDFGLAKHLPSDPDPNPDLASTMTIEETHPGAVVGTHGYMAPEQALGRPVDQRADIFSLGAVLYEMCAGRPAFMASSQGDALDAVLHRDPVGIAGLNPEIPPELVRIVGKCLAKRADERYQSAADLLIDIRTLRRRVESGSSRAGEVSWRWRDRLHSRSLRAFAAVATLAVGGSIAFRVLPHRPGEAGIPVFTTRQLTAGPGWEVDPALSPDGILVAYAVSDGAARSDIYLMDVRGGEPMRLTDDPAADRQPAWFPDGRSLAFVSNRGGRTSVWKVSRLGGSPVLIVPDAKEPAISPDGQSIAFARRAAGGHDRIHVASLATPQSARVLTGDGDGMWDHEHPAWSHDGRTLCYSTWQGLRLVPAAGGKTRRLTSDDVFSRDPAWSADDRFVYFTYLGHDETDLSIWRVAAGGGEPQRLTLGTGPEGQPSIPSNGSILAYSTSMVSREIILLDRRTELRARLVNNKIAYSPSFSPDNSKVYFTSNRSRSDDLWAQPLVEGRPQGPPKRLTDLPGGQATLAVSPDGRWVAFHRNLEGQRDIWIMPEAGGPAVNITNQGGMNVHPSWSPDSGRIAFSSDRDGRQHIWAMPVSGGQPAGPAQRVTEGDALDEFPSWSPDGDRIAFIRATGDVDDVFIVPAEGGLPRQLTHGCSPGDVEWEVPGDALLVSGSWGTDRMEIRRVPADGDDPEPLASPVVFGEESSEGDFCLSRDGRYVAYVEERLRGNIWVLETEGGWH